MLSPDLPHRENPDSPNQAIELVSKVPYPEPRNQEPLSIRFRAKAKINPRLMPSPDATLDTVNEPISTLEILSSKVPRPGRLNPAEKIMMITVKNMISLRED